MSFFFVWINSKSHKSNFLPYKKTTPEWTLSKRCRVILYVWQELVQRDHFTSIFFLSRSLEIYAATSIVTQGRKNWTSSLLWQWLRLYLLPYAFLVRGVRTWGFMLLFWDLNKLGGIIWLKKHRNTKIPSKRQSSSVNLKPNNEFIWEQKRNNRNRSEQALNYLADQLFQISVGRKELLEVQAWCDSVLASMPIKLLIRTA